MKYLDEYRDPVAARGVAARIADIVTRPWTIMEICGGQTHAIMRFGLQELLPAEITLAHGPGCPVCVTPAGKILKAIEIARRDDTILCSFGDMLRVPAGGTSLLAEKADGADVRIVYSPLDAVKLAESHPDKQVVFFAVGFETTAPANGMAVWQARKRDLGNFSVLVSHVLVPPAIEAILSSPDNRVQGFLAAGHVCSVMGTREYDPLALKYRCPMIVTGFEPLDILLGVCMCVEQLEAGDYRVENGYGRAVQAAGNHEALKLMREVFEVTDREWRGLGTIPMSGYRLREEFASWDAELRFGLPPEVSETAGECISGQILRGLKKPCECPAFGTRCTPDHPLGATMVSSEGACAAWHAYRGMEDHAV